jgi:hypothetical protein
MFGETVDTVLRRPVVSIVPIFVDVAGFLAVLLALTLLGTPNLSGAYARATFGFGISTGLPSLADTLDVISATRGLDPYGFALLGVVAVILVPIVAYVEAGFVGLVHAAYIEDRDEPIFELVRESARSRFRPMLVYRSILAVGFLLTLGLAYSSGARNGAAGALALRFLLVFVPYAIVVDGATALHAIKDSLVAIVDNLAICLVLLLFLLLVSGGMAAVVAPFVGRFGGVALIAGMVVYGPIGTVMSTFVLKVWLSLKPEEPLPEATPAPAAAAAPA